MHIKIYRYCSILILIIIFFIYQIAIMLIPVEATSNENSVELICKTESVILSGIHWDVYRVGILNSNNKYELQGDFEDYPIELNDLSTSDMLITANTLENCAVLDDITPNMSGITDNNGSVKFQNLDEGLYLFSGNSITIGETKYIPSAMLIEILPKTENNLQTVDLITYPKFIVKRISNDDTTYTVKKVWINEQDSSYSNPPSIIVELYKDKVLEDTITLDNSNDWSYSWVSKSDEEWRVKEIQIPKYYRINYVFNETQYLVMNIFDTNFGKGGGGGNDTDIMTTTITDTGSDTKTTTNTSNSTDITTITDTGSDTETTTNTSNSTNITTITDTGSNTKTTTDTSNSTNITTITDTGSDTETTTNTSNTTDITTITDTSSDTNITTVTDTSKLTQTGQLWWPVPILSCLGLILIVIGYELYPKSK